MHDFRTVKSGAKPDQWGGVNGWFAASPQAKSDSGRLVCANVFVNKGEDVVKDKPILPVPWSNARSQSLETRARADPFYRIILGGV